MLKEKILDEINSIIDVNKNLTITFLNSTELWNPILRILSEVDGLGKPSNIKDKKKQKQYEYENGLILKSYIFDSYKVADSDGVICIFDARERTTIDETWIHILSNIITSLKKNKVISVGIRVSNEKIWSKLIESFKLDALAEERLVSLLFFRIINDSPLDVYELLSATLDTIKNLSFNY